MNKIWKHFKLVNTHKYYVFKACCKAGIPFRGLLHDMSKFSPVEFFESVKYFTGCSSPINEAKKDKGYSNAWFHHRGRNKHHWIYWVDQISEEGGVGTLMPYKYAVEMMCDFIGAGQAYEKKTWTFDRPYDWFIQQKADRRKIHPAILEFIDIIFLEMKEDSSYDPLNSYNTRETYKICRKRYNV